MNTGSPVKKLIEEERKVIQNDSLDKIVIGYLGLQDIKEVIPINREKRLMYFCQGRVKTEELDKGLLKSIFKASNCDIDVIEEKDCFILQYKDHKPLAISKKDGKFYSRYSKMDQEARIIWEVLRKYSKIETPSRKYRYKQKKLWSDRNEEK